MKKILSLIALAMTIVFSSCSDEACNHQGGGVCPPIENWIEGLWYVEADNEEINFGNSGTFYDRYSNVELSGETEGHYEMDYANMKLTYRYSYLGNNITKDWTVKNHTEFGFKLSSSDASGLDVQKIVEQHKLTVGKTVKLNFATERVDINVSSYKSNNELIATVGSDGTVTAMGGKGTTYIKMTTNAGNIWAKITVGEDNKNLWCDYVSIIGADYNAMRQYFGRLGEPATDGIDYFKYIMSVHQYVESVNILVDTDKDFVKAIQLYIKEGVPPVEINSYLKSRFYEQEGFAFYTTQPDIEESKAIVTYDQEIRCVYLLETQSHLYPELWGDFTKLFGTDKTSVKSAMDKYGYSFLMSDYSYSVDGSDYYYITDNKFLTMAGFVFNPDKQVSEFWLYLNPQSNPNEIYRNFAHYYIEDENESTDESLTFYSKDKSLKVVLNLVYPAVIYTKLTMKQHEAPEQPETQDMLGNYYEGLGMSREQIISHFGTPLVEESDAVGYYVGNEYVSVVVFRMNTEVNKCRRVIVTINESVANTTVMDFFNSKYTVFPNLTEEDGSQYAWTNGPSLAESTLGIIYFPDDKTIYYEPLGSAANVKAMTRAIGSTRSDIGIVDRTKSKASSFLNAKREIRESISKHRAQRLNKALENYIK